MKTLIRFLITYKTLLLFLFLEVISLILIVNYNQFQRSQYLNSSNVIVGSIYKFSNSVSEYFKLKKINNNLAEENAELRNELYAQKRELEFIKQDSTFSIRQKQATEKNYTFIPAKVINVSVNKYKNHITLDKGSTDGIRSEMGVINESGVIGIVSSVSSHFSVVIPVLNPSSRISAKVENKSKTGSLIWDGKDVRRAILEEVPLYVPIAKGDKVITSGYSSIFPEGIQIGTVNSFRKENDSFYFIEVDLSPDFNSLSYVDIIDYKHAEEQKELEEKEVAND